MAAQSKHACTKMNRARNKGFYGVKSSKLARAAKKLENDAAKQRRLAKAAEDIDRRPESQRRLNKNSSNKDGKEPQKVTALAITVNGLTYTVIGDEREGKIIGYDLSPNCHRIGKIIQENLFNKHGIVSKIIVICGDSVKELKKTCCTAVTNGYDGSCMSKVCALKYAYKHLFKGQVSYFFSSWCDVANAKRAYNPNGRSKAGLGMIMTPHICLRVLHFLCMAMWCA